MKKPDGVTVEGGGAVVRVPPAALGYFLDAPTDVEFPETDESPAPAGLRDLLRTVSAVPGLSRVQVTPTWVEDARERGEAQICFTAQGSVGLAMLGRVLSARYPNPSFRPQRRDGGVWYLPTWRLDVTDTDVAPFVAYVLRGDPQTARGLAREIWRLLEPDNAVGAMIREAAPGYPVDDTPVGYEPTDDPRNQCGVSRERVWFCKVGPATKFLEPQADNVMMLAVDAAFRRVTGHDSTFLISGWGSTLTPGELAGMLPDQRPRV